MMELGSYTYVRIADAAMYTAAQHYALSDAFTFTYSYIVVFFMGPTRQ